MLQFPDTGVAVHTQQSANSACVVTMIDMEDVTASARGVCFTDGAAPVLAS
jgi:hypothetical protein